MKKIAALISVIAIIALIFCGCGKTKSNSTALNSASDFNQYSLTLDAPEGATAKSYALIESEKDGEPLNIAEVKYTSESVQCTLRAANVKDYNVSGVDESSGKNEQSYDLNIGSYDSSIRVFQSGNQYVALWTLGNHSYSIVATTDDAITFTTCAMDAANANVPLAG